MTVAQISRWLALVALIVLLPSISVAHGMLTRSQLLIPKSPSFPKRSDCHSASGSKAASARSRCTARGETPRPVR